MNAEAKLRTKLVRIGNPSYDWNGFNGQVTLYSSEGYTVDVLISFHRRLGASLQSVLLVWTIAGIAFCLLGHGPGKILVWTIWGGAMFIAGYLVVGLPLLALDHYLKNMHFGVLICIGGFGGAFFISLPRLLA